MDFDPMENTKSTECFLSIWCLIFLLLLQAMASLPVFKNEMIDF